MQANSLMSLLLVAAAATAAAAETTDRLKLEGEYLGMAPVRLASGQAQLAVIGADLAEPRRNRFVELFDKRGGTLTKSPTMALPVDAAAYDVCRLDPAAKTETLLIVRKGGIHRLGDEKPLVAEPTLFPTGREDGLPRLKLCFALFKDEPPALLVPGLNGVTVFRQPKAGQFARHAAVESEAEIGFQGLVLRGDELTSIQRVNVRLQFPDVTAPDFDGDGLTDLCFNLDERFVCRLQDKATGFTAAKVVRQHFSVQTAAEKSDTSQRLTSRLLDVSGDGRPDMIISQGTWNVSDMRGVVKIYLQEGGGKFPDKPSQQIARDGYFAYQEYVDFDGDGKLDLLAPVAELGWTELAKVYLSRKAEIEFVWYKNAGGRFEDEARAVHSLTFPVDFKNMAAILGSLPIWDVRVTNDAPKVGERHVLFFPGRTAFDLRAATADGVAKQPLWRRDAELGSDTIAVDLDGDGKHELVSAFPKDPKRARSLLFLDPSAEPRGPE